MQDINPDTSLYTDLPNKLRAFAAISEAGGDIECRDGDVGVWRPETAGYSVEDQLALLVQDRDYRLKPKPRELWAIQLPSGALWGNSQGDPKMYPCKPMCADENTPVRFVEQP